MRMVREKAPQISVGGLKKQLRDEGENGWTWE